MIELPLIGHPDEVDTVLAVLADVAELHRSRRKPARGSDDQVIQYGVLALRPHNVENGSGARATFRSS